MVVAISSEFILVPEIDTLNWPPKDPPSGSILGPTFMLTDPKTFIKRSLAPIYTNFKGARRKNLPIFLPKPSNKYL